MTLAGRTVLITRAPEDAAAWVAGVEARGGRAVVRPCLVTRDVPLDEARPALSAAIEGADWVVFTSKRAVVAAGAALPEGLPASARVAVVGSKTGAAVHERFGREPERVGRGGARALAEELLTGQPPKVVAFPAAEQARPELEEVLGAAGVTVRRVTLYRTEAVTDPLDLVALGVDVVLLASPSAARGLAARTRVPADVAVVTIGKTTSAAAREVGLDVAAEARTPGLEPLLDAIP